MEKSQDEYQNVKLLRSKVSELKKVIGSRHIKIRSDAEAVNIAINHMILTYQGNSDNNQKIEEKKDV
jgi:hypothetical protein